MKDAQVQVTADALTSLRTTSPLAVELGLDCPYDSLFANAAGKQLAAMALSVDPVYEQYNIVRYKWFTEQLADAAGRFDQILLLGAGFDTRALTLPALTAAACGIFEVDFPDMLAHKQTVLAAAGIEIPGQLHFVPADLADGGTNRCARCSRLPARRTNGGVHGRGLVLSAPRYFKQIGRPEIARSGTAEPHGLRLLDMQPRRQPQRNACNQDGKKLVRQVSVREFCGGHPAFAATKWLRRYGGVEPRRYLGLLRRQHGRRPARRQLVRRRRKASMNHMTARSSRVRLQRRPGGMTLGLWTEYCRHCYDRRHKPLGKS